jgi:hypothetical protein
MMTFSMMTFSKVTLIITIRNVTLNMAHNALLGVIMMNVMYAECRSGECDGASLSATKTYVFDALY